MIPGGRRGLMVVTVVLMAVPAAAVAQQPQVPATQQGNVGEAKRLGRPFPTPFRAPSQQPGAAVPPGAAAPPGAAGVAPRRLGRGLPAPVQPPPRAEPGVSVSIVSPQQESTVFGRRQRSGNQQSLGGRGGAGGGMGGAGGGLGGRAGGLPMGAPAQ
jgi:hypothetical protein